MDGHDVARVLCGALRIHLNVAVGLAFGRDAQVCYVQIAGSIGRHAFGHVVVLNLADELILQTV